MSTKIISGFPGIGKSELTRTIPGSVDSDSIHFSWLKTPEGENVKDNDGKDVRNPDFPANYIAHIREHIKQGTAVIFVSSHQAIRDALVEDRIPFTLVYPDEALKDEYLERYKNRGSPDRFIEFMDENWSEFLSGIRNQSHCQKIVLNQGQYLSDVIDQARHVPRPIIAKPAEPSPW